jgi:transposase
MYSVEIYVRVRRAVVVEGLSQREAARQFGIHRDTVRKMLAFSLPPGYQRKEPAAKPKIGPFTRVIDQILEEDLGAPKKQRHSAHRIYERLTEEHGLAVGTPSSRTTFGSESW